MTEHYLQLQAIRPSHQLALYEEPVENPEETNIDVGRHAIYMQKVPAGAQLAGGFEPFLHRCAARL